MEYTPEQLERVKKIEMGIYLKFAEICNKYNLMFVTSFGTTLGAIRHHGFIPWDDDMDFMMPRKDYEKFVRIVNKELDDKYEFLETRFTKNYVMTFGKLIRKDSTFVEETDTHIKYHSGIFIDIFPMDFWPQDKKKRDKMAFKCFMLARLCSLASYGKPKLPPKMKTWKRVLARTGCFLIHGILKIFHITSPKLYKKYVKIASSVSSKDAEGYVTDMTWCKLRKGGMVGSQYKYKDLFKPHYVDFEDIQVPVPENYEAYLNVAYDNYKEIPPVEERTYHKPAVLIFPEE